MAWAFLAVKTQPSLRSRALRLLSRREHSREELRRKLVTAAVAGEGEGHCQEIEALLDDLTARGWLSDARFAEHSIRARARRFGPLRLVQQLRARGVDDEMIAAGFRSAAIDGISNIEVVWKSRFNAPPADDRERGRQVRFLQARGFPLPEVIRFIKQLSVTGAMEEDHA
jgi:regulatory protein